MRKNIYYVVTPRCAAAAVVSAVVLRRPTKEYTHPYSMMHRRLPTAGIEVAPHYHQLLVINTSTNKSFWGRSKCVRGQDTSIAVKCKICKRSRHPELGRWGLSQAERLRDGYRYSFLLSCVTPIGTYSFLLSSAFINCCDREMGFGTTKF